MNFNTARLLEDMKNTGGSQQRIAQADKVLAALQDVLLSGEYHAVRVAVSHYRSGEGREELDRECNRLIKKYRGDPPPRYRRVYG